MPSNTHYLFKILIDDAHTSCVRFLVDGSGNSIMLKLMRQMKRQVKCKWTK